MEKATINWKIENYVFFDLNLRFNLFTGDITFRFNDPHGNLTLCLINSSMKFFIFLSVYPCWKLFLHLQLVKNPNYESVFAIIYNYIVLFSHFNFF